MTIESTNAFLGRDVAVIPFPALGDTTIYLRLAQTLATAGARVSLYSDLLAPAADLVPWLAVMPISQREIGRLVEGHELVIADILARPVAHWLATTGARNPPDNLLAVTAKNMPAGFAPPPVPRLLHQQLAGVGPASIHRAICPGVSRGSSMVGWVDRYAAEALRLRPAAEPPPVVMPAGWQADPDAPRRILLFPTTPNPSKNYPLKGFAKLAAMLTAQGWLPEVVCMQHECEEMGKVFPAAMVRTFPSLRELILHVRQSHAVVSNDSGGGHLGSMLSLRTFTITKKSPDFIWRPGFTQNNQVVGPTMTFKWFSGRIWRPFIPLRSIVSALGAAPSNLQR